MCVRGLASKVPGGFHGVLMKICENSCKFAQTLQNLFPNPFQPAGDPLALWPAGVVARQSIRASQGKISGNTWEEAGISGTLNATAKSTMAYRPSCSRAKLPRF